MNSLEELRKKYRNEEVLVVDKKVLSDLGIKAGLESTVPIKSAEEDKKYLDTNRGIVEKALSVMERAYYKPRYLSEHNEDVIQIIPYPVIRTVGSNKVFVTKRLDGRLKGQYSIGTGGHINREDSEGDKLIKCMHRELNEELYIPLDAMRRSVLQMRGIIYNDSNSVSKEHLCILFHVIVPDDVVGFSVREVEKLEGGFRDIAEVKTWTNLESWTEIALETLVETKGGN